MKLRVVCYESIDRDLKIRPVYECRCDERLKTKDEESPRLVYTLSLLRFFITKFSTGLFIMNE